MIITVEDIRKYREIALNTQKNRVEIFIRETSFSVRENCFWWISKTEVLGNGRGIFPM